MPDKNFNNKTSLQLRKTLAKDNLDPDIKREIERELARRQKRWSGSYGGR